MSFGLISALTGVDMSGKFSAANIVPDDVGSTIFPFANTVGDAVGSTYNLVNDPTYTGLARLGYALTPVSAKGLWEKYYFNDKTKGKDPMVVNPKNLEGNIRRTPFDENTRYFGLRSLNESKQMHANRTSREADEFEDRRRQSILQQARDVNFHETDVKVKSEKLRSLMRDYVAWKGQDTEFLSNLETNTVNRKMTEEERRKMKAFSNPLLMRK